MASKREFLEAIRTEKRSAPAGKHWDSFYKHLLHIAKIDPQSKLLNPLILGGDIASHAAKHMRLSEQLDWAEQHGCLADALNFLLQLPPHAWNISNGKDWHDEHPWVRGEW